jgi:cyclophilin family peptidyl-prolyl cis-trans isomerase
MTKMAAVLLAMSVGAGAQVHHAAGHVAAKGKVEPTGPVVVIDTAMGRLTCRLFSKEAPLTAARFVGLATGTLDWKDGETGAVMQGKPFYDGVAMYGASTGLVTGDRMGGAKGVAGPPVEIEKSGIGYDRAGLMVMAKVAAVAGEPKSPMMESSSVFYVLDHANKEYEGSGATVFGVCDAASLGVVEAVSHAMLSVDNHPPKPIGINRVVVLTDGEAMPAVAQDVAPEDVTPQMTPMPVSDVPTPEPTGPTVVIETSMGTLSCRLFNETPVATKNFIGLATGTKEWKMPRTHAVMRGKRFYDGLAFRRVIPDFMVQQSDLPGDPSGGEDIGFHFDNEIVPGLTFDRPGRLAYANAGPDTNESEFFVTEHPVHRLDGKFTIFGQCDDASVKVVEAIARVPRDEKNAPLKAVAIRTVAVSSKQ